MKSKTFITDVLLKAHSDFINEYDNNIFGRSKTLYAATNLASKIKDLSEYLFHEKKSEIIEYYNLASLKADSRLNTWRYHNIPNDKSNSFILCCNIADASKHKIITRKGRLIDSIQDVKELAACIRFQDDKGFYYRIAKIILIHTKTDNEETKLVLFGKNVFESGMRIILEEAIKFGIISHQPIISKSKELPLPRIEGEEVVSVSTLEKQPINSTVLTGLLLVFENNGFRFLRKDDEFNFTNRFTINIDKSPLAQGTIIKVK